MSKPKIGWFCTYTPIEILEAAGIEPYGIRVDSGKAHEDVYLGDAMCSYVRSCLGGALSGDYDFLEGVVIAHSCECMRRLYDGWEFKKADIKPQYLHLLDVPRVYTQRSVEFFAGEIERFKESIEAVFGEISEESLAYSLKESLRTSRLLSKLNEVRKHDEPTITGVQIQEIMIKGMTMPRNAFNDMLEASITNLNARHSHSSGQSRIMVYGGPANLSLIETIEEVGGIVVCEHMCNGLRQIRTGDEPDDDPFKYLARSYLAKAPCPRIIGDHSISGLNEIRKLTKDFRVDGIIYYSIKFCANAQAFSPLFKDMLGNDMPVKMLEGDVSPDINIREVQSFVKKLARRIQQNGTGTEG